MLRSEATVSMTGIALKFHTTNKVASFEDRHELAQHPRVGLDIWGGFDLKLLSKTEKQKQQINLDINESFNGKIKQRTSQTTVLVEATGSGERIPR